MAISINPPRLNEALRNLVYGGLPVPQQKPALPPYHDKKLAAVTPIVDKAKGALDRFMEAIPFKVAQKISSAEFIATVRTTDGQATAYKFEVRFTNARTLEFDAEGFPSDADISRVCLECP